MTHVGGCSSRATTVWQVHTHTYVHTLCTLLTQIMLQCMALLCSTIVKPATCVCVCVCVCVCKHKCADERKKPLSQQKGAVRCISCNRWFGSRGGLAVHRCHSDGQWCWGTSMMLEVPYRDRVAVGRQRNYKLQVYVCICVWPFWLNSRHRLLKR